MTILFEEKKMINIGFIGIGLMGEPMAARLLAAEYPLIAYNRTASKLTSIAQAGATIAHSPLEVVKASDCIILMLTEAVAIKEVLLGDDCCLALKGKTIIQMGTIAPEDSKEIE
jgi:3-hydroxyisobutyrate dehydrogenase